MPESCRIRSDGGKQTRSLVKFYHILLLIGCRFRAVAVEPTFSGLSAFAAIRHPECLSDIAVQVSWEKKANNHLISSLTGTVTGYLLESEYKHIRVTQAAWAAPDLGLIASSRVSCVLCVPCVEVLFSVVEGVLATHCGHTVTVPRTLRPCRLASTSLEALRRGIPDPQYRSVSDDLSMWACRGSG